MMTSRSKRQRPTAPICPSCGKAAELHMNSATIYSGRDFGPTWACAPCDTRVGCHPGTTKALGNLAGKRVRLARSAAHAAFDPLWQAKMQRIPRDGSIRARNSKGIARVDGYRWLSKELKIPFVLCHIGMMDEAQCRRVFELCAPITLRVCGIAVTWTLDAPASAPPSTWQARAESEADARP